MDYFAGLDISMDETRICVVDREGAVVYEGKSASTAEAIADELAKAPSCRRIVFETGRMAPILFHSLSQLGLPVVCVESRQAKRSSRLRPTRPIAMTLEGWRAWADRDFTCTGLKKPVRARCGPLADRRAQETGRAARDLASHVRVDGGDRRHDGGSGGDQAPHGGGETSHPFACFESLIDEGGGERASEPDPKDDRQAPDLIFRMTRASGACRGS